MLNSSVFSDNGSGIPKDFLYFFEIHDLEKKVALETDIGRFNAELKLSNGRWRLMWKTGFTDFLKSKFPDWKNIEPFKPLQNSRIIFARTNDESTYAIDILRDLNAGPLVKNEIFKPPTELSINDANRKSNVRMNLREKFRLKKKKRN